MNSDRRQNLKRLHFELELLRDFSTDYKDKRALDNAAKGVYGVLVREKAKRMEKPNV